MAESCKVQNVAFVVGKSLCPDSRDRVLQLSQKLRAYFRNVYFFTDLPLSFSASFHIIMINPSAGFGTILGKNVERGISNTSVYLFKKDFIFDKKIQSELSWVGNTVQNFLIEDKKSNEYAQYFCDVNKVQFGIHFEDAIWGILGDLK